VAESPIVVAESPIAVAESPIVVGESRIAVAESPIEVAESPIAVAESRVVGVAESPIVVVAESPIVVVAESPIVVVPLWFLNLLLDNRSLSCFVGLHHHIGDSGSGSIGSNRSMDRFTAVRFHLVRFLLQVPAVPRLGY